MKEIFERCEFCKLMGSRQKRLPFGQWDAKGLVILENDADFEGETLRQILIDSFPEALFIYRHTCTGVDFEDARIGCGILLRNLITKYRLIVLPQRMTKEFFGEDMKGSLIETKTGQYVIPYGGKVTAIDIEKEYARGLKQC